MRILASLSSLKLIAIKRDKILLFVLIYLAKYAIRICFKSIDLYLKYYLLIVIF